MEVEEQDGPAKGWTWLDAKAPATTPDEAVRPSVSARAGVPAAGRGSQIDPDQSMRGLEAATTPLAHPTGVDAIDSFTSPVGIASLAAGGAGILRAGAAEGVAAAGKAAVGTAAPFVKYEVVKGGLTTLGVPHWLASAAAAYVSARGSGAAHAEAAEAAEGAHLDRSVPMRPSEMTPQQLRERITQGTGTPAIVRGQPKPPIAAAPIAADVEPVAAAPVAAEAPLAKNSFKDLDAHADRVNETLRSSNTQVTSDQYVKILKQVEDGSTPDRAVANVLGGRPVMQNVAKPLNEVAREATTAKPKMTPDEYKEAARQVKNGISKDDAIDNVRRARELAAMFGSPSAATVAESVAERTARTVARNESNASIVDKIKELASSLKDKGYASPEAEAIKVISDGNAATFGKLMTLYMRSRSVKP